MSRCLGVDYGSCRMGLAISDETGILASPLRTVPINGPRQAIAAIAAACSERMVERVVVGLPLDMQGRTGPAALAVLQFVERLRNELNLPVDTWDERLSTSQVERCLIDANVRRARRRQLRDQMAAQVVLQSYLDARTPLTPIDDFLTE
ncbi:MAG: Holliday junction resolvase RuvX [Lentisphaerae bacterium]|nr:Holliday junction resolvase RuvX [Lentisphaerota bacterium]